MLQPLLHPPAYLLSNFGKTKNPYEGLVRHTENSAA
jgi:hypothetical protein